MIPVSTLYDEYIERRKFTEQKNPFEYIVPPPSRGSEQKMHCLDISSYEPRNSPYSFCSKNQGNRCLQQNVIVGIQEFVAL